MELVAKKHFPFEWEIWVFKMLFENNNPRPIAFLPKLETKVTKLKFLAEKNLLKIK